MLNMKRLVIILLGFCGNAHSFSPKSAVSFSKAPASIRIPNSRLHAVEFIEPSYNLAIGAFGVGLVGGLLEDVRNSEGVKQPTAKLFGGIALLFTLFAGFLAFQTTTLRFTLDDNSFSLVKSNGSPLGDNIKVGGENKWAYSSFENWAFLPSDDFPILVYFKENQTPIENRAEAPIFVDSVEGQAHFFPSIANSKQLEQGFLKNGCKKL
jgi:hypothetical protein